MAGTEKRASKGLRGYSGLRNDLPAERLPADALTTADNIDLDDSGMPSRRDGYALALAGVGAHSLWANEAGDFALFVAGSTLRRLNADMTGTDMVSGLTDGLRMSYAEIGDTVYFCNGAQRGSFVAGAYRVWGIAAPATPALSVTSGDLPPGQYLVTATYRAADGTESGALTGGVITLADGGGISAVFGRSANPLVTQIVVYQSNANGGTLYEAGVLDNPPAGAVVVATLAGPQSDLQRPLMTHLYGTPPLGHLLAAFRGRLLIAQGNRLHFSSPYGYHLFRETDSHAFHGRITMLAPMDDGIFVGASGRTWWASGTAPEAFSFTEVSEDEPIEGSLVYAPGGRIGEGGGDRTAPIWYAADGVVVGASGGVVRGMTEKFRIDPPALAAGMFRRVGDTHQYLCSFLGD
jgi:hypothetical protein